MEAPKNGKRKSTEDDEIQEVNCDERALKKAATILSTHKELDEKAKVDARGRPLPGTKPDDFIRVNITTIQREGINWALKQELSAEDYASWHKQSLQDQTHQPLSLDYGGGIMAADMGLGKTLMLLYLLVGDLIQWAEEWTDKPGCWSDRIHRPARRTLVVCGKAHIHNAWIKDIQTRIDPRLRIRIYIYDDKDLDQQALETADLVITTYQRVLEDLKNYVMPWEDYQKRMKGTKISWGDLEKEWEHLRGRLVKELVQIKRVEQLGARMPLKELPTLEGCIDPRSHLVCQPFLKRGIFSQFWWRVIVDEAHELRNTSAKRFQAALLISAANRWWSTGTPYNNNKGDFASAVTFLRHPGIVYSLDGHRWDCIDKALNDCIFFETVLRIKQTRPELIEQEESLAYLKHDCLEFEIAIHFATEQERQLHEIYIEQLKTVAQALESKRAGFDAPMFEDEDKDTKRKKPPPPAPSSNGTTSEWKEKTLTALDRNKIREEVYAALESGESESAMLLKYYTRARQACVLPAFANSELLKTGLPCYYLEATKVKYLVNYVRTRVPDGDKVLVFSMFVETLKVLKEALKQAGVPATIYAGDSNPKERDANLSRFQAGDSKFKVLLMSEKCGNTGLTITQANWVIYFDPWFNPQVEEQAKKRVYRMGQQKPVRVLRFLIAGSIEEMVRRNAKNKLREANEILKGKGAANPKFTAGEVINQVAYLERTHFAERDEELDYERNTALKNQFRSIPPALASAAVVCLVPYYVARTTNYLPPRSALWRTELEILPPLGTASEPTALIPSNTNSWRVQMADGYGCKVVQLDWMRTVRMVIDTLTMSLDNSLQRIVSNRVSARERVQKAAQENATKRPDVLVKAIEAARKINDTHAISVASELQTLLVQVHHLELYITGDHEVLEKDKHYEGRYSESNRWGGDDYLAIKSQAAKNLSCKARVPLDLDLMILFAYASRNIYRRYIWNSDRMLLNVLTVNSDFARKNAWMPVPASILSATVAPATEGEVEITCHDPDLDNYHSYTSNVLIPAMLSGDSAVVTVAACAFQMTPTQLPREALEPGAELNLGMGRQFQRRVWTARIKGEDPLLGIACSLAKYKDSELRLGYEAVFVPGAYVVQDQPSSVKARDLLEKQLIQHGFFKPEDLAKPLSERLSHRDRLHNLGITAGFANVLQTTNPTLEPMPDVESVAGSDEAEEDDAAAREAALGIGAFLVCAGRKKFVLSQYRVGAEPTAM